MEEPGTNYLDPDSLVGLLKQKPDLLLLDLRSFLNFNQCHLQSSINVCVPQSLLKRKNFSLTSVESTISCLQSRDKFKQRDGTEIVIYDGESDRAKKSVTLSCLIQKFREEGLVSAVHFLQGGFKSFFEKYPNLCNVDPITAAQNQQSQQNSLSHSIPMGISLRNLPLLTPSQTPGEYDKEPVQIFDFLFVGSQDVAYNLETLGRHKLTYILNAAKECHDAFVGNPLLHYLRLDLLDCATQNLDLSVFDTAFGFIDEAQAKGQKVLVHCRAGQSRSATIVISYIMRTYRWPLSKAYRFVQGKRPSVSPNLGFISQLINFERQVLGHSTNIQKLLCSDPSPSPITPPLERNVIPLPINCN